jgi:GT2 family glycosyltransferase
MAQQVDWVTGASVLFRTTALEDAGFFDDSLFLYHEEVELMWRLRLKRWSVWYEPLSKVIHDGGAATGIRYLPAASSSPRRPRYWYDSRRVMFKRMYGSTAALMASLAWLTGHSLWLTRQLLGFVGSHTPAQREFSDNLRALFRFVGDPPRRSSPAKPGQLPQWLERSR